MHPQTTNSFQGLENLRSTSSFKLKLFKKHGNARPDVNIVLSREIHLPQFKSYLTPEFPPGWKQFWWYFDLERPENSLKSFRLFGIPKLLTSAGLVSEIFLCHFPLPPLQFLVRPCLDHVLEDLRHQRCERLPRPNGDNISQNTQWWGVGIWRDHLQ